jgi:dihydrofolate reductase
MGPFRREDAALRVVEEPLGGSMADDELRPGIDEVSALKQQPGKDIYLVGGATTTASFIEAGLVDELRLLVYPLVAGGGAALFATATGHHRLTLRTVGRPSDGRVSLVYELESRNEPVSAA